MIAFYSPEYFLPLPEGHPFPMEKFPQAAALLQAECPDLLMDIPPPATEGELALVHSEEYLEKIRSGRLDGTERLKLGLPWSPDLFHRSALEAGGTVAAARAALQNGLAFNLAGGTHHASAGAGAGFCVFHDVAIAIRVMRREVGLERVMVIDTDAHQGDGTNAIFREVPSVRTYSIHVGRNYPSRKVPGTVDVELPRWVTGSEYLKALHGTLPEFLREPADLVFWITGVDLHAEDRFGQMRLGHADLAARDRAVAQWVLDLGVPVVVVYGGGYHRAPGMTARLHADTVRHVLEVAAPASPRAKGVGKAEEFRLFNRPASL
ncbi:MAG: histone deacetylase [Candidatus Methylacidiphilales bacterium]